jgi:hypothetical protein
VLLLPCCDHSGVCTERRCCIWRCVDALREFLSHSASCCNVSLLQISKYPVPIALPGYGYNHLRALCLTFEMHAAGVHHTDGGDLKVWPLSIRCFANAKLLVIMRRYPDQRPVWSTWPVPCSFERLLQVIGPTWTSLTQPGSSTCVHGLQPRLAPRVQYDGSGASWNQ